MYDRPHHHHPGAAEETNRLASRGGRRVRPPPLPADHTCHDGGRMGLNMHLTGERRYRDRGPERGGWRSESVELGYWRKHPNLHGYIVRTFAGADDCRPIPLDAAGIRRILAAVEAGGLPPTQGFYFGRSDGTETAGDLAVFREALQWLETVDPVAHREVYYQASW